jgi:predicted RNase H-like HicB family nuclease
MNTIDVIHHDETPAGWWADSPEIPGWYVAGATFAETRQLAEEGVRFALEREDLTVEHVVPTAPASAA